MNRLLTFFIGVLLLSTITNAMDLPVTLVNDTSAVVTIYDIQKHQQSSSAGAKSSSQEIAQNGTLKLGTGIKKFKIAVPHGNLETTYYTVKLPKKFNASSLTLSIQTLLASRYGVKIKSSKSTNSTSVH